MRVRWHRRTHSLLIAPVAVALAMLLALQSWWLWRLQQSAATADRATLTNYLDTVLVDLLYDYGSRADQALRLPAQLFVTGPVERTADLLRRTDFAGARTFFVRRLVGGRTEVLWFFDRAKGELVERPPSAETRAAIVASKSYELFAQKGVAIDKATIQVEERDPDHRILMMPVLADDARVVGVAGLILDEDYFRQVKIPDTVRRSLPRFFPEQVLGNIYVRIVDGQGRPVFETTPGARDAAEVSRPLSYVFQDWRIVAGNRLPHPAAMARANLWVTLALSALAAAVLVGGLAAALRTSARELRLSQLKSDFLANVSHELRTPLSSIRVFAEFLRLGRVEPTEKVKEYGEYIDAESRRLSKLVENLLDFSRIESGQKRYLLQPMDLRPALEETLLSFRGRVEGKGPLIDYVAPEGSFPRVDLDPDAFSQALFNLLDNALKYGRSDQPIEVRLAHSSSEVTVAVRDHGIGIPAAEHSKVFERFHRVGSSLIHDVKGSGLGLSIVQHVMQAHGGRVTLESTPGVGSTFRLHFPVRGPVEE